jgi:hypothetical protein
LLVAFVLTGLLYVAVRGWTRDGCHRRLAVLALTGFVLGWSFMAWLPAWTWEHFGFSGDRHLLLFWGLATGGVAAALLRDLALALSGTGRLGARVAASCLTLALVVPLLWIVALNAQATRVLWAKAKRTSWAPTFDIIRSVVGDIPANAVVLGNAYLRPELTYAVHRYPLVIDDPPAIADNTGFYSDKTAPRYYLFYQRWGGPDDAFFPNVPENQLAKAKALLAYLDQHGDLVRANGRWRLYKI